MVTLSVPLIRHTSFTGAGHNNIEMEMPTAYIKRLQQFIKQCDRQLYPQNKAVASPPPQTATALKMARNHQQQCRVGQMALSSSERMAATPKTTRPCIKRYASQDTFHDGKQSNMAPIGGRCAAVVSNGDSMPLNPIPQYPRPSGGIGNKQRKQKGTLVMKSSHNSQQQQPQVKQRHSPQIGVHSNTMTDHQSQLNPLPTVQYQQYPQYQQQHMRPQYNRAVSLPVTHHQYHQQRQTLPRGAYAPHGVATATGAAPVYGRE